MGRSRRLVWERLRPLRGRWGCGMALLSLRAFKTYAQISSLFFSIGTSQKRRAEAEELARISHTHYLENAS